ncbi:MAG: hypothetical protein JWP78_1310 [Mucilaginibacter sp.]|nr:hypothetical protein [Mucilaginibacter sp.]
MNQELSQYFDNADQKWQTDTCKHLRETILQSVPGIEELLQYGKPHYKKDGKLVCTYNIAKAWVSFTLFNAASLEAPEGFFEPGDHPDRRTIRIREGQNTDYNFLATLLQQASGPLS